jgi:hypothetical protein
LVSFTLGIGNLFSFALPLKVFVVMGDGIGVFNKTSAPARLKNLADALESFKTLFAFGLEKTGCSLREVFLSKCKTNLPTPNTLLRRRSERLWSCQNRAQSSG